MAGAPSWRGGGSGADDYRPARGIDVTTGDEYEAALRTLPEAYSLAIRLQDAGVADEEICNYLHIERESLGPLLELARRKLDTAILNPGG
jgi:DNA-directed RNA polymerase specialized sigma24 family protein